MTNTNRSKLRLNHVNMSVENLPSKRAFRRILQNATLSSTREENTLDQF